MFQKFIGKTDLLGSRLNLSVHFEPLSEGFIGHAITNHATVCTKGNGKDNMENSPAKWRDSDFD